MNQQKHVLLSGIQSRDGLAEALKLAEVHYLDELDDKGLDELLPRIDCFIGSAWSKALDRKRIARMTRLRFIQSTSAGVNHFPFEYLNKDVILCSNAGGYSEGVGEYAIALLLAAAKKVEWFDNEIKTRRMKEISFGMRKKVSVLNGKTLGILGYGGIGRAAARMGMAFGMRIYAFSRHDEHDPGVKIFKGREGMLEVLRKSDAVIISLPLTKATEKIIGAAELAVMKTDCILVNIGRGDIVNENDIYQHLSKNPSFVYATDVWWSKDGKESLSPELPFLRLENFIGTPHISGPSAHNTDEPSDHAIKNLLRFLKGETPMNIVDRTEYL